MVFQEPPPCCYVSQHSNSIHCNVHEVRAAECREGAHSASNERCFPWARFSTSRGPYRITCKYVLFCLQTLRFHSTVTTLLLLVLGALRSHALGEIHKPQAGLAGRSNGDHEVAG